jgi:hypothetical protein
MQASGKIGGAIASDIIAIRHHSLRAAGLSTYNGIMANGKDFLRVRKLGRRKVYFLGFKKKDNLLISLHDLTAVVKPGAESYQGIRQIPVSKIIGTEDRADDFAIGFLPLRNSMERRWTRVRDLLLGPGISEAIRVIEYGGYYFVRDGNHRVSVAKSNGIAFFDAEVKSYHVPVSLLPDMTPKKIPLFKAKMDFYTETRLFDYVPEDRIGNGHPESWQLLSQQILPRYRSRFQEQTGREPESGEMEKKLFEGPFVQIMNIVQRQALPSLFVGRYDLDICCDMLRSYSQESDSFSPAEAFQRYIQKYRRTHLLRRVVHTVTRRIKWVTSTVEEANDNFLRMTRLHTFCPDAEIAAGRKDWYRFLTRQVVMTHAGYLRQETGSVPTIGDLAKSWYYDLYCPAFELYKSRDLRIPFPVFYMLWMKSWQKQTVRAVRKYGYAKKIGMGESFVSFLHRAGTRLTYKE